jgi:alpha-tubulin suppressor-like RCC1 family protein
VPVSVLGNKKTFCAIAAGQNHTVAVDNHGYVWSWGRNDDYSELGMPDVTTSTRTPMMIVY